MQHVSLILTSPSHEGSAFGTIGDLVALLLLHGRIWSLLGRHTCEQWSRVLLGVLGRGLCEVRKAFLMRSKHQSEDVEEKVVGRKRRGFYGQKGKLRFVTCRAHTAAHTAAHTSSVMLRRTIRG